MNPMKDALNKRKGKSLDVAVMVGEPKSDPGAMAGDNKDSTDGDLAPKGDPMNSGSSMDMGDGKNSDDSDKLMQLMTMLKGKPEAQSLVADLFSGSKDMDDSKQSNMAPPSNDEKSGMNQDLVGGMDDSDKADLASRTKPRSLFERARMAQLNK